MKKLKNSRILPSSFRDKSGFLFYREGSLYRQVNISYKENYELLMNSGIYDLLVKNKLLIPHTEVKIDSEQKNIAYKIINPQSIPFISYPYEWCFSQLKDAALLTLKIQKIIFEHGMTLKDASAYNIQFKNGKAIFIDTLSFEKYHDDEPWLAYKQFCQHFLATLALMSYKDVRLNQLFRVYVDGIPLDFASKLLPFLSYFNFSLLSHIHFHSKSQKHFENKPIDTSAYKMKRTSFLGLIDNLESAIKNLKWKPKGSEWTNYYEKTNYSSTAHNHKKQIIDNFLNELKPKNVWDFGANEGIFSRIASNKGIQTISFDNDPAAVEKNYIECCKRNDTKILPLLLDMTNPSPGIGWQNMERMSLSERSNADTIFVLALIHHLVISNNLPFYKIAGYFSSLCDTLIIEFIPKTDYQLQKLLLTRKDIFTDYTQDFFEKEFCSFFTIQHSVKIKDSDRYIYLMRRIK